MATYEELYGKRVKEFDSDPTLESSYEGQVWYDKSSGTLRSVVSFGAWRSGGNLNVPRSLGGISGGTQTASLAYAGYLGGPGNSNSTEEYNGSGWGSGGNVNTARRGGAGVGVQTAALLCGGYSTTPTTFVEEYNGTSWSEETNIPTDLGAGAGTQTAALIFTGTTAVSYDGTNWTASTSLPTAMTGGTGLQTAALAVIPPPSGTTTLEWDGSSWATGGAYNTARPSGLGGMTSGIQTSAISAGTVASPPPARVGGITEQYDGTSWATSSGTQGTARNSYMTSAATNTAALIAGGAPYTTATEEFNQSINTITAAAWASGGSLNTGRVLGGSAITSATSGIVFGGSSPYTGKTESYNGSSWSEVGGDMNTARGYLSGFGTSTAAVAAGGYTAPNNPQSLVEEWNGSAWSEETNLPASRKSAGNCGTLTAGLIFGGSSAQPYTGNLVTTTFEYDGSSWTASGALPEAKGQAASGGTQTAAFYAGGNTAPGRSAKTAFYNGSSWSEGADVVTISPSSGGLGATGTTSAGLGTSGDNLTNIYDGTAWATSPNYSTARNRGMGGATASDALLVGGYSAPLSPAYRAETEQFTGETETINAKTLTTS